MLSTVVSIEWRHNKGVFLTWNQGVYKTRNTTSLKGGFLVFSKEQQNHDSKNRTKSLCNYKLFEYWTVSFTPLSLLDVYPAHYKYTQIAEP